MVLGGCQFKGAPAAPSSPAPAPAAAPQATASQPGQNNPPDVWRPRAAQIRIYPSTRFVTQNGKALLAADVEPVDAMGDPIKIVGRLRCELFAATGGGGDNVSPGRRLYSWDVNLFTLADQRKYYDPVTRGYLLRLELDSPAVAKQSTLLRVTLVPLTGHRLQTQRRLPIKW